MTKVGFVLGSTLPPVLLPGASRAIENAGFDCIWMSEDYFFTGGVAGATTALGATERISVGIGLLPVYVRHPALTAMEAGAVAGAFPDRFKLGFGSGVPAWLDQIGLQHRAPLGTMRETVASVRALLGGETVDDGTHFTFDSVKLAFPPERVPPIYIGATKPRMTALAGEIADGVLMSVLATPEFVANSRKIIDEANPPGAARTEVTAFAIFSVADDADEARAAARPVVAGYLANGPSDLTNAAGISDELTAILADGGRERLLAELPDSWIDEVSICGDGQICRNRIEQFIDAGADEIALMPVEPTDLVHRIGRVGELLALTQA